MTGLPIVENCHGCGVCCLQMGFPTFMLPAKPLSDDEIDADPKLYERAKDPNIRKHLRDGHPGESYWHTLPENLRSELLAYWEDQSENINQIDGPCIWLDPTTRLCKHHEYRPRVCRDFDINSLVCRQWRSHYRDLIEQ